tara:strand:- start:43 stop:297 length:255 start_codon:yes stop_codon:yes gene_type:complete
MSPNKEDLKNKIIYRSTYRGSKEMDILMSNFIKSLIDDLNIEQLEQLNKLVNLEDEILISIKNNQHNANFLDSFVVEKFKNFKL